MSTVTFTDLLFTKSVLTTVLGLCTAAAVAVHAMHFHFGKLAAVGLFIPITVVYVLVIRHVAGMELDRLEEVQD